jgi:hypothetical protein
MAAYYGPMNASATSITAIDAIAGNYGSRATVIRLLLIDGERPGR